MTELEHVYIYSGILNEIRTPHPKRNNRQKAPVSRVEFMDGWATATLIIED
jgi:hypothetical protein